MKITIRASNDRPIFTTLRDGAPRYIPLRAWRVYADGERQWGLYVVEHRTGLTVIRDGRMVTSWHAGIGPGDLARHAHKYGYLAP